MLSFLTILPEYRLITSLDKRPLLRFGKGLSLTSVFNSIRQVRQGSRISRPFRPIFSHKRLKTMLGLGLAILMLLFSTTASTGTLAAQENSTAGITVLSAGAIILTTNQGVRNPVEKIMITQRFSFFHQAVDLDGVTGDPIYPIMAGTIEATINDRFGLGKHVVVDHGAGFKSIYAHLSQFNVKVGDHVENGQVIGKMGNTGRSFGDHLHLEVSDNGRKINPLTILPVK